MRRQYLSDLQGSLADDNAAYARAVKKLTGWTVAENARAYADLYYRYLLTPRGLDDIAFEMGVEPERLRMALATEGSPPPNGTGRLDAVLSGLLRSPESKIRAEHAEETHGEFWRLYLLRAKQ